MKSEKAYVWVCKFTYLFDEIACSSKSIWQSTHVIVQTDDVYKWQNVWKKTHAICYVIMHSLSATLFIETHW